MRVSVCVPSSCASGAFLFSYDPRADATARFYQTIEFRLLDHEAAALGIEADAQQHSGGGADGGGGGGGGLGYVARSGNTSTMNSEYIDRNPFSPKMQNKIMGQVSEASFSIVSVYQEKYENRISNHPYFYCYCSLSLSLSISLSLI